MTAPCENKNLMIDILIHLTNSGYVPMIAQAKQQFLSVFGKIDSIETILQELRPESPTVTSASDNASKMSSAILDGKQGLLNGDIFCSPLSKGLLFIRLERAGGMSITFTGDKGSTFTLSYKFTIGYFGNREEVDCLNDFAKLITEVLKNRGSKIKWSLEHSSSSLFDDLLHNDEAQFVSAETVSIEDTKLADKLENQDTREVAIAIKRAGGMLVDDVNKKVNKQEDANKIIERLVQTNLITREFVVICRKTSHQTNRMSTRDAIDRMAEIGVTCSCGAPIIDERIEELFLPTPKLEKMLKQSYWSTARLVHIFRQLGVQDNRILLNLQDGPEEIDAFVDLEGSLLMIELKDDVFSMGHAYKFGSRIGLYKPAYAIIVSTKGVAPEVKNYFGKVKPESNLVYVDKMSQLLSFLEDIMEEIQARKAIRALADLDFVKISLLPILLAKFGFEWSNSESDEGLFE
jgi:hypothetical protein